MNAAHGLGVRSYAAATLARVALVAAALQSACADPPQPTLWDAYSALYNITGVTADGTVVLLSQRAFVTPDATLLTLDAPCVRRAPIASVQCPYGGPTRKSACAGSRARTTALWCRRQRARARRGTLAQRRVT